VEAKVEVKVEVEVEGLGFRSIASYERLVKERRVFNKL
jgi:hypothetical protein